MTRAAALCSALALACCGLCWRAAFVSSGSAADASTPAAPQRSGFSADPARSGMASLGLTEVTASPSLSSFGTFLAGVCLGLFMLVVTPGAASAEVEDQQIPVDGKGKTMTFSKEQLVRAKRLYNNTCAICHVGGGTRTNQNVGLSFEELEGAVPARTNINALVAFLNNPTTYDGLYDISETHPSIKSADLFPKMRSMKQQDLYDMSAYVLYNCQTIPEKWGGGKQYY